MYTFHFDPGHAWLEVTLREITDVGLTSEHFSPYSFRNGSTLWLEEDVDAPLFAAFYAKKHGKAPPTKDVHHRMRPWFCRYDRCTGNRYNFEWSCKHIREFFQPA